MESNPANNIRNRRGPLRAALDLFSSIRLGIVLIALIVLYSSVGSAVPVSRQAFELTEFEYFNHPIFVALIALFCLNLVVATVRRIPLSLRNLGVLTVHAGLLVLCAGSVVYFGRKIEGDVRLDAPRIAVRSLARMQAGDGGILDMFAAAAGRVWSQNMPMAGGQYRIDVAEVRHQDMKTGAFVRLHVRTGDDAPRTMDLDQSAPDGAFKKINDKIGVQLLAANVADEFLDYQTPMLAVEYGGKSARFELPSLPYYEERFVPGVEIIRDTNGKEAASGRHRSAPVLERWEMPIRSIASGSAAASDWPFDIEIDGYLPYAELRPTPRSGGATVNPIAKVDLTAGGERQENWLASAVPSRSMLELADAVAEFRWLGEGTELDPEWTRPVEGRHIVEVHVKDKDVRRVLDVKQGDKIKIDGTDYELTVEQLQPGWPLMTAGFENARSPTALIWVQTPERGYQRSVLQRFPQLNQDRDRQGAKLSETGLVDGNIDIRYLDASRHHFLLAAGRDLAPLVVHTAPGGRRTVQRLGAGESFAPADGVALKLIELIDKPRFVNEPAVIPEPARQPFGDVRRSHSLVRVHLTGRDGGWSRRVWVAFSQYNYEDPVVPPTEVTDLPGMRMVRLLYGRMPRKLPCPLTLERLQTDFYPGRDRASGWTSYVRFRDDRTNKVHQTKAWLNNTATIGGWTFFQSTASGDHESWTGLGVGNRDGVMTMLAGCTLITLGMIYAFCVKPVLIRRMTRRAMDYSSRPRGDGRTQPAGPPKPGRQVDARPTAAVPGLLIAILAAGALVCGPASREAAASDTDPTAGLAAAQERIDLKTLGAMMIVYNARHSTVESWARDSIQHIHGSKDMLGLDPLAAAIDVMLNARQYVDDPVIYVKDRGLRRHITSHPIQIDRDEARRIMRTGLVSYRFLTSPAVAKRLEELSADTRMVKAMDRVTAATSYFERLIQTFTVVPSPLGGPDAPWYTLAELTANLAQRGDIAGHEHGVPGVSSAQAGEVLLAFRDFTDAWSKRDVDGINTGIRKLDRLLPALAPDGAYPTVERRRAEVMYHRLNLLRWSWAAYIAGFFVAVFTLATRYRWAHAVQYALLAAAVAVHGVDVGLRWYVIERIPVANMYEAVVSSTLLGTLFGLLLEAFWRRGIFGLATGFLGMFALALPELNIIHNRIDTMMPILDDVMLRIHTVLIIASYAVITLAFGVANCYLGVAAFRDGNRLAHGTIGAQLGMIACLVAAKLGWFAETEPARFIAAILAFGAGGALLMAGASSLIQKPRPALAAGGFNPDDFPVRRSILGEFDLSHRVLLYTAMVALFVGLVLGAVWADYSWGRPWGWDPKEVFALNTWLIYAILIHARFVARDRALWTAVLSVFGFCAMQFNWWVVNFYIVGLHSYA